MYISQKESEKVRFYSWRVFVIFLLEEKSTQFRMMACMVSFREIREVLAKDMAEPQ